MDEEAPDEAPSDEARSDEALSKDRFYAEIGVVAEAMIAAHGREFAMGVLVLAARFIAEGRPLIPTGDDKVAWHGGARPPKHGGARPPKQDGARPPKQDGAHAG